jgi:hypothetical protein
MSNSAMRVMTKFKKRTTPTPTSKWRKKNNERKINGGENVAEYINRNELLEMMQKGYCGTCNNYSGILCRSCLMDDALRDIEDAPAADVVEVVRCKDCKHWSGEDTKDYLFGERWGECHRPFGSYGCENSTENDFCSYGERREVCEKD